MTKETLEERIITWTVSILSSALIAFAVAPEQTGEIVYQGFNKARTTYQKVEPYLKTINSAAELAAMSSFGVWDPNWKPYKRNSTE